MHATHSNQNQNLSRLLGFSLAILLMSSGISIVRGEFIENPNNGHLYGFTELPGNWFEVNDMAIAAGGHLATITSQAEQDWIWENFSRELAGPTGSNIFWLGLVDVSNGVDDFDWQWVTDEAFEYTNWRRHNPDFHGKEEYGLMFHGDWDSRTFDNRQQQWFDVPIEDLPEDYLVNRRRLGLIEISLGASVPEPQTFTMIGMGMIGLIGSTTILRRRSKQPKS